MEFILQIQINLLIQFKVGLISRVAFRIGKEGFAFLEQLRAGGGHVLIETRADAR